MRIEYPKWVYNKDGAGVLVKDIEQHNVVKAYFPLSEAREVTIITYQKALSIINEVKAELKEEKKQVEEKPEIVDIKEMSWHRLRAYGKELEKEYGVELPLRAKRDQVEKAINEVLDGNDKRSNQS